MLTAFSISSRPEEDADRVPAASGPLKSPMANMRGGDDEVPASARPAAPRGCTGSSGPARRTAAYSSVRAR